MKKTLLLADKDWTVVYEQIWRLSDYKTSLENRLHHLKKMITEIEDQKTRDLSNQKHTMQILSTLNTEDLRLIQLCDEKLKMYNNIDRQGIPHRGSLSQFRGSLERIRYNIERISMCTDHNSRIHGVLLSEITSAFDKINTFELYTL
ncbi:hypothetical protein DPMN_041085 [Dreissena polymorpha]|uniref:Uncharacterized protein n=1 Tax=Dreissena polymorpha TaxID=45954 RepID=A0A9D4CYE2_DREPO|nr:hypothetical protein DPMN_041085 [Dreissena polymorpha]